MAKVLPQRELRNDIAKVIDDVVAGETYVLTRNGERVAQLRPIRAARRTFVPRSDLDPLAWAGDRIDQQL